LGACEQHVTTPPRNPEALAREAVCGDMEFPESGTLFCEFVRVDDDEKRCSIIQRVPHYGKLSTDDEILILTLLEVFGQSSKYDTVEMEGVINGPGDFIPHVPPEDEIIDMVSNDGVSLGMVSRSDAHRHNILHAGIGMLVQQDDKIYCHQRTASKRMFPSLYDMFVAGVRLHDETSEATAQREIAEELGLTEVSHISPKLFSCVVCTSYNRCVVDFYTYDMKEDETVVWQGSEVAWGDVCD